MYDTSGHHGKEARRMSGSATALDEVVLETRCHRCRSLILVERLDPSAQIPVVEECAPMICASCTMPDGRLPRSTP